MIYYLQKTEITKKTSKLFITTGGSVEKKDDQLIHRTSTLEAKSVTTIQSKCSLQEGVRMMVTPSMLVTGQHEATEKAILNPPANVQKAVVVTQNTKSTSSGGLKELSASKMVANIATSQFKTLTAVTGSPSESKIEDDKKLQSPTNTTNGQSSQFDPSWHSTSISPTHKTLGRQKRIIEPSITPATTPVSQTGITSSSNDESSKSKSSNKKNIKTTSIDRTINYGSPDSPMSKMNLMSPPGQDNTDGLITPKSITQLELPTPERLLPIGQHGKDGITALVEKVREALTIPDISHLKQDSLDKSDSTREDVTPNSRSNSPRKLTKQIALESPPTHLSGPDDIHSTLVKTVTHDFKYERNMGRDGTYRAQRNRLRKVGLFAMDAHTTTDTKVKHAGSWQPINLQKDDSDTEDDLPSNEYQPVIKIF